MSGSIYYSYHLMPGEKTFELSALLTPTVLLLGIKNIMQLFAAEGHFMVSKCPLKISIIVLRYSIDSNCHGVHHRHPQAPGLLKPRTFFKTTLIEISHLSELTKRSQSFNLFSSLNSFLHFLLMRT